MEELIKNVFGVYFYEGNELDITDEVNPRRRFIFSLSIDKLESYIVDNASIIYGTVLDIPKNTVFKVLKKKITVTYLDTFEGTKKNLKCENVDKVEITDAKYSCYLENKSFKVLEYNPETKKIVIRLI